MASDTVTSHIGCKKALFKATRKNYKSISSLKKNSTTPSLSVRCGQVPDFQELLRWNSSNQENKDLFQLEDEDIMVSKLINTHNYLCFNGIAIEDWQKPKVRFLICHLQNKLRHL